ncbi:helix-turn-helix transcriptional regulator [Bradyrhizobium sp. 1(2017)]|uniref:helix-turn-helix transcriptional regulator n=1 Tax=Bradyrhizobium sp. 1(2017) TaxID=1404888 RepID=UPI00140F3118|nr:AlpA family phage regulatory protein [Bradyrhizobium sp. 1(2017)]QIO34361.1 AlpA family phage regulatory protein [Bradyrhizobium sp. 1(2017)]
MSEDQEDVREMITAEQVLALIPVSRTTLFRMERDGVFPRGEAISPHRKLWFKDEVMAWQRDLRDPKSALAQAMRARNTKGRPRSLPRPVKVAG